MRALAFAAGLALVIAGSAQAQPAPPSATPDQAFGALDKNSDGGITKDEWVASGRPEQYFAYVDGDHDGKVSKPELTAAMARMRAQRPG